MTTNKTNWDTSTKVINLFGAPSSGKSTCAAELFSSMKKEGLNCELVTEFAKEIVYSEDKRLIKNQLIVLGEQYRRIFVLQGKVDFIITDSPVLLSIVYNEYNRSFTNKSFNEVCWEAHNKYNNVNYVLPLLNAFEIRGRVHNSEESINIDLKIREMLNSNNEFYKILGTEEDRVKDIMEDLK